MTQRVRRAERLRRQRSDDRGFVYRGAHVYRWADEARRAVSRYRDALAKPAASFVDLMWRQMCGSDVNLLRMIGFELGAADLLWPEPKREVADAKPE